MANASSLLTDLKITLYPHHQTDLRRLIVCDACDTACAWADLIIAAPPSEPSHERGPDELKPTDGAADSKINVDSTASTSSSQPRATHKKTIVFESDIAITPRSSCVYQHRNGKDITSHAPVSTPPSLTFTYILIDSI